MAGKPQAEKAVERFPELGCFAGAPHCVREGDDARQRHQEKRNQQIRLVCRNGRKRGKADASAEPCILFRHCGRSRNHARGANCRDAEGSRSAGEEQWGEG